MSPNSRQRVVVTGGAGFIGSNLVRSLLEDDFEVIVVDDLSSGLAENLDGCKAELISGSICDSTVLDYALEGADVIVHLAARPSVPRSIKDPLTTHEVNATGTVKTLEASRRAGIKCMVIASSSSVYGNNEVASKNEDLPAMPASPYAASKLAAEQYALAYSHSFGMKILALRFFNVYGPYQRADSAYSAVVPSFVSAALDSRPLQVEGDGLQTRDFTYVDDVVGVLSRAVREKTSSRSPVNLAFGTNVSVLDLAGELERILGKRLERVHREPRAGDVRNSRADPSRLLELMPGIRQTQISTGLSATVAWHAQEPE